MTTAAQWLSEGQLETPVTPRSLRIVSLSERETVERRAEEVSALRVEAATIVHCAEI